jgi:Calx-beta domain/PASTA domain
MKSILCRLRPEKRRLLWLGVLVALVAAAFVAPGVASAETVSGTLTSTDPIQTGRLARTDPESTCALPQPQAAQDALPRHYDAFTFVNPNAATTCMTVTVNAMTCVGAMFLQSAAYIPLFNRENVLQNVAADIGASPDNPTPIKSYSFNVPASQKFDVVINEVGVNAFCPGYSLTVTPGVFPALSINDVSVGEGNGGTTNAVFTVTLSTSASQTITANFATADGTAVAGTDYTATSGVVTFAPGETSKTIAVPVVGNTVFESTETFALNLSNPALANIGDASGVGTIINDDAAPPPVRCRVPRVVGLRLATAKRRIRARNCRVGRVRRVRAKRSKVGKVVRQSPRAGAVRARNFRVTLVVGRR